VRAITAAGPLQGIGPVGRACIVAGIPGVSDVAIPDLEAYETEAPLVIGEGLAPVAVRLFDSDPSFRSSPAHASYVRAAKAAQMHTLAVDFASEPFLAALDALDARAVIIKGPAVSRFHPDTWPRSYSDLDVLVPPERFDSVLSAAITKGYEYPSAAMPPRGWVDHYCREGVNLHGPANIDVHHHVPPWVLGMALQPSAVAAASDDGSINGRRVRLACREHCAVIAALHVFNDLWKGRQGLSSWRDLIVLLRSSDPSSIVATFGDLELGWLLDLFTTAVDQSVPEANITVTGATPTPPRIAYRIRLLGWDRASMLTRHRGAWVGRLPLPHAIAFLAASVVPSRSYIRSRHGSYRQYWLRAWRETISTIGGADYRASGTHSGTPLPG
jgi:Uncharacterised nucleotidyltransferase